MGQGLLILFGHANRGSNEFAARHMVRTRTSWSYLPSSLVLERSQHTARIWPVSPQYVFTSVDYFMADNWPIDFCKVKIAVISRVAGYQRLKMCCYQAFSYERSEWRCFRYWSFKADWKSDRHDESFPNVANRPYRAGLPQVSNFVWCKRYTCR